MQISCISRAYCASVDFFISFLKMSEKTEYLPITKKSRTKAKVGHYVQIFLAEYMATALLMFMVCLGCMDGLSSTPLSPIQSPLTSGFAVTSLVTTFGHISSAHMNPAVTACFLSLGKIDLITSLVYFVAEMLGAVTGVGILRGLIPWSLLQNNPGQCRTIVLPQMGTVNGAIFEFLLTSFLISVVCGLVDARNSNKQDSGALKFGFVVAALSFAGGSLTGASLNPARSFAPAFWTGDWAGHWVYWAGPLAAGFIIPKIYQFLFGKDYTINSDQ